MHLIMLLYCLWLFQSSEFSVAADTEHRLTNTENKRLSIVSWRWETWLNVPELGFVHTNCFRFS